MTGLKGASQGRLAIGDRIGCGEQGVQEFHGPGTHFTPRNQEIGQPGNILRGIAGIAERREREIVRHRHVRVPGGIEQGEGHRLRAGTVVSATGATDGDWWRVRARVDGRDVDGWASSLWLRRTDERH